MVRTELNKAVADTVGLQSDGDKALSNVCREELAAF